MNSNVLRTLLGGILVVVSLGAFVSIAGGSSSSGGFFAGDRYNPWFLQNTKTAFYCVDVDEQSFSASRSLIEEVVDEAISYWKQAFSNMNQKEYFQIATQQFQLVTCDSPVAPDIRFQMGVLTEVQKEYLNDPTSLVAHAQRTNYNPSQMKGEGFIYVSPDSGNLSVGDDPMRWSRNSGTLLKAVLIHELGHVFGLRHDSVNTVMAEDFPENILYFPVDLIETKMFQKLLDSILNTSPLNPRRNTRATICEDEQVKYTQVSELFHAPNSGCIFIELSMDPSHVSLIVNQQGDDDNIVEVGSAETIKYRVASNHQAINIEVPSEREVFLDLEEEILVNRYYKGFFTPSHEVIVLEYSSGNMQKDLQIIVEPHLVSIGGMVGGQWSPGVINFLPL